MPTHSQDDSTRYVVGLMSGTSVDGLDISLCEFRSDTAIRLLDQHTVPYTAQQRQLILEHAFQPSCSTAELARLNVWLGKLFAQHVLEAWHSRPCWQSVKIDLIASHGQTVFHAPAYSHDDSVLGSQNATLQVGDGDVIATLCGVPTLSDFRLKFIAHGLMGAPLAPFIDRLLFSHPTLNTVLINLGGIANFTIVPTGGSWAGFAYSDTGPANCMLDMAIKHFYPSYKHAFDLDGRLARSGCCNNALLNKLKEHSFLRMPAPKSCGPEDFNLNYLLNAIGAAEIAPADIMATLTEFSAITIASALAATSSIPPHATPATPESSAGPRILISGGGAENSFLVERLEAALGQSVAIFDAFPHSHKEAVLFATLGYQSLFGQGTAISSSLSIRAGKLSLPN